MQRNRSQPTLIQEQSTNRVVDSILNPIPKPPRGNQIQLQPLAKMNTVRQFTNPQPQVINKNVQNFQNSSSPLINVSDPNNSQYGINDQGSLLTQQQANVLRKYSSNQQLRLPNQNQQINNAYQTVTQSQQMSEAQAAQIQQVQSQMKAKFDELLAEKKLLQLKLKEKQLKSEKEAREKAILKNMELQMQKQIKKQRGNSRNGQKGDDYDNSSDSERENDHALVRALKDQQSELTKLLTNTRTKQEEKLLSENHELMKRLEQIEQKKGIKHKNNQNKNALENEVEEENKQSSNKNSFLERMNGQNAINNHLLMRQGILPNQLANPLIQNQLGQMNLINPMSQINPYVPGYQSLLQNQFQMNPALQSNLLGFPPQQPLITQTYMHPQLGLQQQIYNPALGMQQSTALANQLYPLGQFNPQIGLLNQPQSIQQIPQLDINSMQSPNNQIMRQINSLNYNPAMPQVPQLNYPLSLQKPVLQDKSKLDTDRDQDDGAETDNDFETPLAIKQKLRNDEIIRQMRQMNGDQFIDLAQKSQIRPQSSSRKLNQLDDGDT